MSRIESNGLSSEVNDFSYSKSKSKKKDDKKKREEDNQDQDSPIHPINTSSDKKNLRIKNLEI